ncbi:MAG TPA: glycosyltransferase [Verrucomicrobiae bacterium]
MTQVPSNRLSTIYYGYKHKRLARSVRQPFDSSRPLRVGLLGRICPSKGHHLLVEAANKLKKQALGQFQFRFIGDALNLDELSSIKGLIARLDVEDAIEFRGYRSDIAAELANLDVLAVPSIAEPFGRILCEAAEASLPVLVSDSGGLGELSWRFDVGLRFRGGDSEDLARQLQSIRSDYSEIESRFKPAAQRLLSALNLSDYIARIEELLNTAAAGKSTSIEWLGSAEEGFSNMSPAIQPSLS